MADEAKCISDPNYAIICSFIENFGKSCRGITFPDFRELQQMLEASQEVPESLIQLHVSLLRKIYSSVTKEKWERCLIKFAHTYSNKDGWEMERFGYKNAKQTIKTRIFKELLERQFDRNIKFKNDINRMPASQLRVEPIGKDIKGQSYWCFLDDEANVRLYRENVDDETFDLIASTRSELATVIDELNKLCEKGNTIASIFAEEDSSSFDGKETKSEKSNGKGSEHVNEEEVKKEENKHEEVKMEEVKEEVEKEEVKLVKLNEEKVRKQSDENGVKNSIKNINGQAKVINKVPICAINVKNDRKTNGDEMDSDDDEIDSEEMDEEQSDEEIDEEIDDEMDEESECEEASDKSKNVSEPIEEPVMVIKGSGEGELNDASNPIVGMEITEELLYVYGEGSGADCDVGNPEVDEEKKTIDSSLGKFQIAHLLNDRASSSASKFTSDGLLDLSKSHDMNETKTEEVVIDGKEVDVNLNVERDGNNMEMDGKNDEMIVDDGNKMEEQSTIDEVTDLSEKTDESLKIKETGVDEAEKNETIEAATDVLEENNAVKDVENFKNDSIDYTIAHNSLKSNENNVRTSENNVKIDGDEIKCKKTLDNTVKEDVPTKLDDADEPKRDDAIDENQFKSETSDILKPNDDRVGNIDEKCNDLSVLNERGHQETLEKSMEICENDPKTKLESCAETSCTLLESNSSKKDVENDEIVAGNVEETSLDGEKDRKSSEVDDKRDAEVVESLNASEDQILVNAASTEVEENSVGREIDDEMEKQERNKEKQESTEKTEKPSDVEKTNSENLGTVSDAVVSKTSDNSTGKETDEELKDTIGKIEGEKVADEFLDVKDHEMNDRHQESLNAEEAVRSSNAEEAVRSSDAEDAVRSSNAEEAVRSSDAEENASQTNEEAVDQSQSTCEEAITKEPIKEVCNAEDSEMPEVKQETEIERSLNESKASRKAEDDQIKLTESELMNVEVDKIHEKTVEKETTEKSEDMEAPGQNVESKEAVETGDMAKNELVGEEEQVKNREVHGEDENNASNIDESNKDETHVEETTQEKEEVNEETSIIVEKNDEDDFEKKVEVEEVQRTVESKENDEVVEKPSIEITHAVEEMSKIPSEEVVSKEILEESTEKIEKSQEKIVDTQEISEKTEPIAEEDKKNDVAEVNEANEPVTQLQSEEKEVISVPESNENIDKVVGNKEKCIEATVNDDENHLDEKDEPREAVEEEKPKALEEDKPKAQEDAKPKEAQEEDKPKAQEDAKPKEAQEEEKPKTQEDAKPKEAQEEEKPKAQEEEKLKAQEADKPKDAQEDAKPKEAQEEEKPKAQEDAKSKQAQEEDKQKAITSTSETLASDREEKHPENEKEIEKNESIKQTNEKDDVPTLKTTRITRNTRSRPSETPVKRPVKGGKQKPTPLKTPVTKKPVKIVKKSPKGVQKKVAVDDNDDESDGKVDVKVKVGVKAGNKAVDVKVGSKLSKVATEEDSDDDNESEGSDSEDGDDESEDESKGDVKSKIKPSTKVEKKSAPSKKPSKAKTTKGNKPEDSDDSENEEEAASKKPAKSKVDEKKELKKPAAGKGATKKVKLLGLEIDETTLRNARDDVPVRQSRRIAQLKIREEAERRKIEELAYEEIEKTHKKKPSQTKCVTKDAKSPKTLKKTKSKYTDDDDESDDEAEVSKRVKKTKQSRFDENHPWRSSSGSSSAASGNDEVYSDEEVDIRLSAIKSDHEFSPESDLEETDTGAVVSKHARTAQVEETGTSEKDDFACRKCNKMDHPEWILLCDSCDSGWHCSCLRPALLVIPEGDWYCPPCQHATLITRLKLKLNELDVVEKQVVARRKHQENEALRKQRLEYVTVNPSNVLTRPRSQTSALSSHAPSTQPTSSDDDEPIYQLRRRKHAGTYNFNEYDALIKSAIKDEVEAVKGAGNQGRGKDIQTIIDDKEPEGDDKKSDVAKRGKVKRKRKTVRLTELDFESGDDEEDDSDEDFKGSNSSSEEDMLDMSDQSDDSVANLVRRSARNHRARYDEDFINDGSEDDQPKKRKRARSWESDDSGSESSGWKRSSKKPRAPRTHVATKKRRAPRDSVSPVAKKKKSRVVYGLDEPTVLTPRRTRGRNVNYRDMSDSEEDKLKKPITKTNTDDEYNEKDDDEEVAISSSEESFSDDPDQAQNTNETPKIDPKTDANVNNAPHTSPKNENNNPGSPNVDKHPKPSQNATSNETVLQNNELKSNENELTNNTEMNAARKSGVKGGRGSRGSRTPRGTPKLPRGGSRGGAQARKSRDSNVDDNIDRKATSRGRGVARGRGRPPLVKNLEKGEIPSHLQGDFDDDSSDLDSMDSDGLDDSDLDDSSDLGSDEMNVIAKKPALDKEKTIGKMKKALKKKLDDDDDEFSSDEDDESDSFDDEPSTVDPQPESKLSKLLTQKSVPYRPKFPAIIYPAQRPGASSNPEEIPITAATTTVVTSTTTPEPLATPTTVFPNIAKEDTSKVMATTEQPTSNTTTNPVPSSTQPLLSNIMSAFPPTGPLTFPPKHPAFTPPTYPTNMYPSSVPKSPLGEMLTNKRPPIHAGIPGMVPGAIPGPPPPQSFDFRNFPPKTTPFMLGNFGASPGALPAYGMPNFPAMNTPAPKVKKSRSKKEVGPAMTSDDATEPPKRRGRGKGKKTLAAEMARSHDSSSQDSKSSDSTNLPKLGIAPPPQPFAQPTPSVITRMLQAQPMVAPQAFPPVSHAPGSHAPVSHAPGSHAPGSHGPGSHAPVSHAPVSLPPASVHSPQPAAGRYFPPELLRRPPRSSPPPVYNTPPVNTNVEKPTSTSAASNIGRPPPLKHSPYPPPPGIANFYNNMGRIPPPAQGLQHPGISAVPPGHHPPAHSSSLPPNYYYAGYTPAYHGPYQPQFINRPPSPVVKYEEEAPSESSTGGGEFGGLVSYFSSQRDDLGA